MSTSQRQTDAFLALRRDIQGEENWHTFWDAWDGFIRVIIRHKLFFAPDLWEDAKSQTDAKLFRFLERFDESREISPWLSRVVASACEDVKRKAGHRMQAEPQSGAAVSFDEEGMADWLSAKLTDPEAGERERMDDIWLAVETALTRVSVEPSKKTAFYLYYRYDYKLRDIAATFRLPPSTVNNWPGAVLRKILPEVRRELTAMGYRPDQQPSHVKESRRHTRG